MIYDFQEIYEYYSNALSEAPDWFGAAFGILHLVFVIICIKSNNNESLKDGVKKSANTVNTFFWLTIILKFPFLGIILYSIFSLWLGKKLRSVGLSVPAWKLKWYQLLAVPCFGTFLKLIYPSSSAHPELIGAFIALIVSTVFDAAESFCGKKIMVEVKTPYDPYEKSERSILMDKPYYAQSMDNIESMTKCARIAGDRYFGETYSDKPVLYGEAESGDGRAEYVIYDPPSNLIKAGLDVSESYCRLSEGITIMRCITEEESQYSDRFVFSVTPKIRYMVIRFAVILFILLMLFTPLFNKIGTATVGFLAGLVSGMGA